MKLLRILLSAFVFLSAFQVDASHIIGGDIQYEYLGNNQYYIKLVIYREMTGIQLQPTEVVTARSNSCGVSVDITLTRTQQYAASAFDCISASSASFSPEVNVYETTVANPLTLTQSCSDFVIFWHECCKPLGITNLAGNTNTLGFYFEAELNRRVGIGNNSSPTFLSAPIAYLCDGGTYIYTQNAAEPDGDSLQYELIQPREWDNGINGPLNIAYQGNFSSNNPFSTAQSNPYTLDAKTGNITFTTQLPPSTIREVSVIAMRVNEYRWDAAYGIWDKVGSSNREIQVIVAQNCHNYVNNGVQLDQNMPGVYQDVDGQLVKDYGCNDTSVTLHFSLPVECYSVANDGTDFRITAPNGQPIPVKKATPFCNNDFETDSIRLTLYKPLVFNGDYSLYSKVGTDGNTLLNKCGVGMDEFDTIILRVGGCLTPEYEVRNVTVVDDQHTFIQWELDTTTMPESLVDFIRVFRSDDAGATYQQVGVAGPGDPGFHDYGVNPTLVDTKSFKYQVQFVANGTDLQKTTPVQSILLQGNLTNKRVPMNWNDYDGWTNPTYTVELGIQNGSSYTWTPVSDPTFPTTGTNYTFNANALSAGGYALRVKTNTVSGFQSESNWITFGIPTEPEEPAVALRIPNLFTPGPDQFNGRWTIDGIDSYDQVELVVYDRWGKKVYEDKNYTNSTAWDGRSSSGNDCAEGTYFYVLSATGGPNGASAETNGSITLLRED